MGSLASAAALLAACGGNVDSNPSDLNSMAQMLRAAKLEAEDDGFLSFDVVLTEPDAGGAIDCQRGRFSVDVEMRNSRGRYERVQQQHVQVRCKSSVGPDIALVVDNSGSEEGTLDEVRDASERLIDWVERANGRISLVRVSTETSVLEPLVPDPEQTRAALSELFISNGWTALYDGIRVGNETLGDAQLAEDQQALSNGAEFCDLDPQRAIVVFTDGDDNNSSDEHGNEHYPGDGINTGFEDLLRLETRGVSTPIYSVGLGDMVDHEALGDLAERSGGKHHRTTSAGAVTEIFQHIASYGGPRFRVCAQLPAPSCGSTAVRLSYTWEGDGRTITGSRESEVHVACPTPPPQGKSATVLLTLQNPGIAERDARELVRRTTEWVSPVAAPRVLVVLDDSHHDEFAEDAAYVAAALERAHISHELLQEPENGLSESALDGFDVIWFSNPGYPMDDVSSFQTLQAALGRGMGVVLQGDDMAWSWGHSFDMSPLTHLNFQDNGTEACGLRTDNNAGDGQFLVQAIDTHPMLGALGGRSFSYGDDIDLTSPSNSGEQVLAWANVVNQGSSQPACDTRVPVVVAYDPALAPAP